MERKSIFIFDEALNKGGYPDGCPFDSGRPGRTAEIISSLGLLHLPGASQIPPIPLTREQMLTFHTADYLKVLDRAGRGIHDFKTLRSGLGTPDCPMFEEMLQFLALAAGGSTTGAGLILSGEANIVFNPSGGFHHAGPDTASGFCYINDIVLAAKMLAREKKRVMVLDLDAHHGDGVQNAFWDRSDVVTVSMHEDGRTLFPGTGAVDEIGEGDGLGCSVNIPLPVGTYDAVYYRAFTEVVLPLVEAVAPDVLILCLGMDGLAGDPLAHLNLTNNVYADIIADLVELDIPILATGGGGYHPENTARGWALAWSIFAVGRDEGIAGFGMGGVMLENTAWFGGLRDRTLLSHGGYRESVEKEVLDTVAAIQTQIFALHGLPG